MGTPTVPPVTPPPTQPPATGNTVEGTVKTSDGTPICAMVLVSGQYEFSCAGAGAFNLSGLATETDGTMKLQVYADGFVPYTKVLNGSSAENVEMVRSGTCPNYNTVETPTIQPPTPGEMVTVRGSVLVQNTTEAVCAMVLANGQYRFSCGGAGAFEFDVPLDANGQVKMQVYADGFAPYIVNFDRTRTMQDARLAKASECR